MITSRKTSTLINEQLPDFVTEEGPKLEAFIRAYYEWMEQSNNAIEVSKDLMSRADLDTTPTDYFQYFRNEIFKNVPDDAVVDKSLLAKNIRSLYYSKGTDKSYRILFRAMFNEDIDVYFPSDYILRTSDGRWNEPTIIRLVGINLTQAEGLLGQLLTNRSTGGTARVEEIVQTQEVGSTITEATVSNVVGSFDDGQSVISDITSTIADIYGLSGGLENVAIQSGIVSLPRGFGAGVFHQSGDLITFTSDAGSGANGTIIATNDQSSINVAIISGGSGYVNNLPLIFTGGTGLGAVGKISSIGNTSVQSICQDTIIPMANIRLNHGLRWVTGSGNTASVSANLAVANISSSIITGLLFQNTTTGTITSLSMSRYGSGYGSLPGVTVLNPTIAAAGLADAHDGGILGQNAVLNPIHLPGSITEVEINAKGVAYSKFENIGIVNSSRVGTVNAIATPIVSGVFVRTGKYLSTKGFLSNDQKLQNDFYQDFSYVVKSSRGINTYRETVKKLLHPAGTKLFGETTIISNLTATPIIEFDTEIFINLGAINTANFANTVSAIEPPFNETSGRLYVYNYITLAPYLTANLGHGTVRPSKTIPTTLSVFGSIPILDLNNHKLAFGNNTHFNPSSAATPASGQTMPGFIRTLSHNANVVVGNGGTIFNSKHQVGDMINAINTANDTSIFVRIVSIAGASSMVTNPILTYSNTTYTSAGANSFALTSNTTVGAVLKQPPPLLNTYDVVIFNSTGSNTDGQYTVNVVSSAVNNMISLGQSYGGPTLSSGRFAYVGH
jgi:hypothetical protein